MKKAYLTTGVVFAILVFFVFSVYAQNSVPRRGISPVQGAKVVSFKINNGSAITTSRTVTLNNVTERARSFAASERPDLKGASWKPIQSAPTYRLSEGYGTKTVYFQVKDSRGIKSAIARDTITLKPSKRTARDEVRVLPGPPKVISFSINNNERSTISRTVTLNNVTENAKYFAASEKPDLQGAYWKNMHPAPSYILSEGYETKTVYFQVADAKGRKSDIVRDTIIVKSPKPVISNVKMKSYPAPPLIERRDSVNCPDGWCWKVPTTIFATNSPTHFRYSEHENFSGATWKTYRANPNIYLKRKGIERTVYFQVKNEHGLSEAKGSYFFVTRRKEFTMHAANAMTWAKRRGFQFKGVGEHPLCVCNIKTEKGKIRLEIPILPYDVRCAYSLFYGKRLHSGWKFHSDYNKCFTERRPKVNDTDIHYQINRHAQIGYGDHCYFETITLTGPGDGLPWEAFY
jgi:hypothetical protein